MTTYTAIANSEIDADSPVTTTLMQAMRDNPIAIAEGSADATVVAAGWHPYDMVNVGDGNDGAIYDSATDGAVATVATPAFVDGYEYMLVFETVGGSTSPAAFEVSFYLDVAATYNAYTTVTGIFDPRTTNKIRGEWLIRLPRVPTFYRTSEITLSNATSSGELATAQHSFTSGVIETIGGARVRWSSGSINSGRIILLRRREYYTA